jgi:hypothetical protein
VPEQEDHLVVLSDLFKEGCDGLGVDHQSDPLIQAAQWAVATRPEFYPEIPGTTLRRLIVPAMPWLPRYRIFYRIEGDTVVLEHIERLSNWNEEPDYYG